VESGREADEWRPAKEFVGRGELYKTIHSTRRDLKQTQAALTALQKHHQYVFEKAHKQALAELKQQKRTAIRENDLERLEELDSQIEEVQEKHQEEKVALTTQQAEVATAGVHPEFAGWQERNPWYTVDSDLREYADAVGLIYFNKNPGVTPQQVLAYVEQGVRKKFPEKFGTRKAAPNAVAGVNKSLGNKKGPSDRFELDPMEREIMNTLVKSGAITEEQYIADLKKVKTNG